MAPLLINLAVALLLTRPPLQTCATLDDACRDVPMRRRYTSPPCRAAVACWRLALRVAS